jgi:phosphomannomutase
MTMFSSMDIGKIKFGTAGLREIMGPLPGQMNIETIHVVTQGLANYIKKFPKKLSEGGVVICHDSRINSRKFAEESAKVLAGNGIVAHLTCDLRPTPFASFAIRYYKSIAGINITASHNPKEYNGYKVYWEDGAQVVYPHDEEITKEVEKVTKTHLANLDDPLIQIIDHACETSYLNAINSLKINKDLDKNFGKELSIIYSPLNGAGITMIPKALEMWGFSQVQLVEEQKNPDGNFPTTPYPNPETEAALTLGIRDLKAKGGDLLLVSDPDSDRLSASIIYKNSPRRLSGNELGSIMLHYLINELKPKGNWATVTTIVSTPLIKKMTEKAGGTSFEVLTGFKYIGEKIHLWEKNQSYSFLFGMEESLGFLYGTHARDKDATIAACLTAEISLSLKKQNKNLIDKLFEIYNEFGIFREAQLTLSSEKGLDFLVGKLDSIRKNPPKTLLGTPITKIEDYLTSTSKDLLTGKTSKLDLPKSDVLAFSLQDESKYLLRPSGTEPKLKIYGHIFGKSSLFPSIENGALALENQIKSNLEHLKSELNF